MSDGQQSRKQGLLQTPRFSVPMSARPTTSVAIARVMELDALDYIKGRAHSVGLLGSQGKVRINKTGCLDRCAQGPVCVVYPDNVWYQYVDRGDWTKF